MDRFDGSIDELKELVSSSGEKGEWESLPNNHYKFTSTTGAVMNWWDTKKKTVSFQGRPAIADALKAKMSVVFGGGVIEPSAPSVLNGAAPASPKQIFIVHGHDETARDQLELILHRLDLKPFILQTTSGGGLTIIEALEKRIGQKGDAAFGIVLLTPDDIGYAEKEGPDEAKARSRQNVILELGMLISSITRQRIAILEKGQIEIPSDADGILRFRFHKHVKEIAPKLIERLQMAGFQIDPTKITAASQ